MNELSNFDEELLKKAFALAKIAEGKTLPNPAVGALIWNNGQCLGEGYTQPAGSDHAEVQALKKAQAAHPELIAGSTCYVTLEPCCIHGRTPPCTQALLDAGVAKVFIGHLDPNPKVCGQGVAQLREAGLEVYQLPKTSALHQNLKEFYQGFSHWILHGKPFVHVKVATSINGHLNDSIGKQTSITGPESKLFVHHLRYWADAVAVGAGTLKIDDPNLHARLLMDFPQALNKTGTIDSVRCRPLSIVFAGQTDLKDCQDSQLFHPNRLHETYVLGPRKYDLPEGLRQIQVEGFKGPGLGDTQEELNYDENYWESALTELGKLGIHRLLIEPGKKLWTSLIKGKAWNRITLLQGPHVFSGGESIWKDLFIDLDGTFNSSGMEERPRSHWQKIKDVQLGDDSGWQLNLETCTDRSDLS